MIIILIILLFILIVVSIYQITNAKKYSRWLEKCLIQANTDIERLEAKYKHICSQNASNKRWKDIYKKQRDSSINNLVFYRNLRTVMET